MGREDDQSAVVNTKGLVKGVKRLRIVDASIFPFLPPGHTQATVCMDILSSLERLMKLMNQMQIDALAEKVAADILSEKTN